MIVIDASVLVKLFRQELGSDAAVNIMQKNAGDISAPDVLAIEVAGVLVRDGNNDPGLKSLQQAKLNHLGELLESEAVQLVRSQPVSVWRAANLALTMGTPIKDCLYLVLARDLNCPLITADARFAAKASGFAPILLLDQ